MAKVIVEVIKVMVVGDISSIEMEIENLWGKKERINDHHAMQEKYLNFLF